MFTNAKLIRGIQKFYVALVCFSFVRTTLKANF